MFGIVLTFLLLMLDGLVGMFCWNWFMPLVFPNITHLNIGTAIGLILVGAVILPWTPNYDSIGDEEKTNLRIIYGVAITLTIWGMAFITHLFVH